MTINYSKELDAAFDAVQCLETVLEETYRSVPTREQLIPLTSAVFVLWRRLRPFCITMFKRYYDGEDGNLQMLDKLEIETIERVKQGKYDKNNITTDRYRVVLTYDAACEQSRVLIELYFKVKSVLGGAING